MVPRTYDNIWRANIQKGPIFGEDLYFGFYKIRSSVKAFLAGWRDCKADTPGLNFGHDPWPKSRRRSAKSWGQDSSPGLIPENRGT